MGGVREGRGAVRGQSRDASAEPPSRWHGSRLLVALFRLQQRFPCAHKNPPRDCQRFIKCRDAVCSADYLCHFLTLHINARNLANLASRVKRLLDTAARRVYMPQKKGSPRHDLT